MQTLIQQISSLLLVDFEVYSLPRRLNHLLTWNQKQQMLQQKLKRKNVKASISSPPQFDTTIKIKSSNPIMNPSSESLIMNYDQGVMNLSTQNISSLEISRLLRENNEILKNLYLSGCGLTHVPKELENCMKLEELNLSNNFLSAPDISRLRGLSLKKLDLSCCGLQQLPKGLEYCNKLEELNLSNNHLSASDISSLQGLPLKKLDLSRCRLKRVPYDLLGQKTMLRLLNLSKNYIRTKRLLKKLSVGEIWSWSRRKMMPKSTPIKLLFGRIVFTRNDGGER